MQEATEGDAMKNPQKPTTIKTNTKTIKLHLHAKNISLV
jgi:hypothetical protein